MALDQDDNFYWISLGILIIFLLDNDGYYRERLVVNYFWEVKGWEKKVTRSESCAPLPVKSNSLYSDSACFKKSTEKSIVSKTLLELDIYSEQKTNSMEVAFSQFEKKEILETWLTCTETSSDLGTVAQSFQDKSAQNKRHLSLQFVIDSNWASTGELLLLPWYINVDKTPSLKTGKRITSWLKHMIRFWRGSDSAPVKSLEQSTDSV